MSSYSQDPIFNKPCKSCKKKLALQVESFFIAQWPTPRASHNKELSNWYNILVDK